MQITLDLTDAQVAALRAALAGSAPDPRTDPEPNIRPAQPPASADPVGGFDLVQRYEWDWNAGGILIYTGEAKPGHASGGGIGSNGLVTIGFVALERDPDSVGSLSIAPFPGDLQNATRTVSIGERPGDFSAPWPSTRTGVDAGIQWQVGWHSHRLFPVLRPGMRYYLNIATRDAAGNSTHAMAGRACDMVIQANAPMA